MTKDSEKELEELHKEAAKHLDEIIAESKSHVETPKSKNHPKSPGYSKPGEVILMPDFEEKKKKKIKRIRPFIKPKPAKKQIKIISKKKPKKKRLPLKILLGFVLLFLAFVLIIILYLLVETNQPTPMIENNLEVVVYDAKTLYSIPNAKVQLMQNNEIINETITNEKGIAYFTVKDGVYSINIQKKGYEELWYDHQNQQNTRQVVDFPLIRLGFCLENWTCTEWSQCFNGKQTRVCIDNNDCEFAYEKPEEKATCELKPCENNTDCEDGVNCTKDQCTGNGTTCTYTDVTECVHNDGHCPEKCNHITDNDCDPNGGGSPGGEEPECESNSDCDNGICCDEECVEPECESDTDCEDNNPCRKEHCQEANSCEAKCSWEKITDCKDDDQCCPEGCEGLDNDCEVECIDKVGCNDIGDTYCNIQENTIYTCGEEGDGDDCLEYTSSQDCSGCICSCGDYTDTGDESVVSCEDGLDNDCDGDTDTEDDDCSNCISSGNPCGTDPCCSGKCDDETNYCFSCVDCFGNPFCSLYESGECEEQCGVPEECDDTTSSEHTLLNSCTKTGETYFQDECYHCGLQDLNICNSTGDCTAEPACNGLSPGTVLDTCSFAGEDFFLDQCNSSCGIVDKDNVCRSDPGCTGDLSCNGTTVGGSCGAGICNATCQCEIGSACEDEGGVCSLGCCSGLTCDSSDDTCINCEGAGLNFDSVDNKCEEDCGANTICDENDPGTSNGEYCCTTDCSASNTILECTCSGECDQGFCETSENCYFGISCTPGGWWNTDNCSLEDSCGPGPLETGKTCSNSGCSPGNTYSCNALNYCEGPDDHQECGGEDYYCTSNTISWVWVTSDNLPSEDCEDGWDNDCDGYTDCDDTDCIGTSSCECGNNILDSGEECDGPHDSACPGLCINSECACGNIESTLEDECGDNSTGYSLPHASRYECDWPITGNVVDCCQEYIQTHVHEVSPYNQIGGRRVNVTYYPGGPSDGTGTLQVNYSPNNIDWFSKPVIGVNCKETKSTIYNFDMGFRYVKVEVGGECGYIDYSKAEVLCLDQEDCWNGLDDDCDDLVDYDDPDC